jgi:hypothetical protein
VTLAPDAPSAVDGSNRATDRCTIPRARASAALPDHHAGLDEIAPLPLQRHCEMFVLDRHAGLDVPALTAGGEIGRRDQSDLPIDHHALGVQLTVDFFAAVRGSK